MPKIETDLEECELAAFGRGVRCRYRFTARWRSGHQKLVFIGNAARFARPCRTRKQSNPLSESIMSVSRQKPFWACVRNLLSNKVFVLQDQPNTVDQANTYATNAERIIIRLAEADDAPSLRDIYAPHVAGPAVSFENEPPTLQELKQRIESAREMHPWIVAVRGDETIGYAHARSYRDRPAWRWCCETSIYVAPEFQGQGVARRLYDCLFELLKMQGYTHAFAIIMLPNEPSVRLHECYGFSNRAILPKAANKRGRWYDVGWWQLTFGRAAANPQVPLPFAEIDLGAVLELLDRRSNARLRAI